MTETTETTETTTELAEYNSEILKAHPGVRETFILLLEQVPEPAEDAAAAIVATILAAEHAFEVDRPWDAEGMRDFLDQPLSVNGVHKMPSAFDKGLGVFLVCQCTLIASGEPVVLTTGSVSIVAQLVRLHTLNALPQRVIPRQSERPSRNGYWPMHLEIVKTGAARS